MPPTLPQKSAQPALLALDHDPASLDRLRQYADGQFVIHATSDPQEALTMAGRRSFAVAVINVLLPGDPSSYAVVRQLREDASSTPAIVGLVEETSPAASDLMFQAGFDAIVAVPFTRESILDGIARARMAYR